MNAIHNEWDIYTRKIFLLGYAYNLSSYASLTGKNINARNIKRILRNTEKIFVFGPDAGIIQNQFLPNLKKKYKVYNVLSAVKHLLPNYSKYNLAHLERYFLHIKRKYDMKDQRDNLADIFTYDPNSVIAYNYEDVTNTIRLINELNKNFNFNWENFRLY